MMLRYLTLLIILLFSFNLCSQETITLSGSLKDKTGTVINAHIFNKSSKKGTISGDSGEFSIQVSLNDILEISSIQHYKKIIVISQDMIAQKEVQFELILKDYVLKEVEIDNQDLFAKFQGSIDPKLEVIALNNSGKALDFSNVDVKANADYHKNEKEQQHVKNVTDPTKNFEGVSARFHLPFSSIKKSNQQKKDFAYKERFPKLIKSKLGADFFHKRLKIPKDRFYHFLSYCESLGIEKLYKEGKLLQVMDIFVKEHKEYLKIIKEE